MVLLQMAEKPIETRRKAAEKYIEKQKADSTGGAPSLEGRFQEVGAAPPSVAKRRRVPEAGSGGTPPSTRGGEGQASGSGAQRPAAAQLQPEEDQGEESASNTETENK